MERVLVQSNLTAHVLRHLLHVVEHVGSAVELEVNNADGRLSPGTFCQVRWPVRRTAPSLFVPSGSVASTTGRTFVIRVRGGRTEWVDVKTGLTSGSLIEVFGDLESGDEIAARGTDEVRAGSQVQIKPAKPA